MSGRSQATLEASLLEHWGAGAPAGAGDPDAWLLEVEGRRLVLHPGLRRWLRHDPRHDEWYDTGYGPGEALLLGTAEGLGAKRLPDRLAPPGQLAAIGDWCIYREGARLVGPVPGEVARDAVRRGRIAVSATLWSAGATSWLSTDAFLALPPPGSLAPVALARADAPRSRAWLIPDRGRRAGDAIPLRERSRLGRDSGCEVVLDDPLASREHAALEWRTDRWHVVDLGSRNGTSRNGARLTAPTPLADGDLLQVGDTRLRFRETPV